MNAKFKNGDKVKITSNYGKSKYGIIVGEIANGRTSKYIVRIGHIGASQDVVVLTKDMELI